MGSSAYRAGVRFLQPQRTEARVGIQGHLGACRQRQGRPGHVVFCICRVSRGPVRSSEARLSLKVGRWRGYR